MGLLDVTVPLAGVRINTGPAMVVGSRLGGPDRCLPFYAEVKPGVGLMSPLLSSRDTDREPGGSDRCWEPNISILFWLRWSGRGGAGREGSTGGCNSDVNPRELKSRAAPALMEPARR